MSGWDQARRVALAEPWDAFWVDVNPDIVMGDWLDFDKAWRAAQASPVVENIDPLVAMLGKLVIRHNIVDREGQPLEFELRRLTAGLTAAIVEAIRSAQEGAGEAVDPFGNPVRSAEPSLVALPSPRGSRSSRSPAGTRRRTSSSSGRRAG